MKKPKNCSWKEIREIRDRTADMSYRLRQLGLKLDHYSFETDTYHCFAYVAYLEGRNETFVLVDGLTRERKDLVSNYFLSTITGKSEAHAPYGWGLVLRGIVEEHNKVSSADLEKRLKEAVSGVRV